MLDCVIRGGTLVDGTGARARRADVGIRGRLAAGDFADVVVFDPAQIGPGPVHTRHDLPGGAARLYAEAAGIRCVLVNGEMVVRDGEWTGALPGTVLRSGRDRQTVPAPGGSVSSPPPPTSGQETRG